MADYMASRNFIGIPSIIEEWEEVACEWAAEHRELPF
jgi:hypothetical protein